MKIKFNYNEAPLFDFIADCTSVLTTIHFDKKKEYRICKGTPYAMTVTTDIVDPLKDAAKDIGALFIKFVKEVNEK
jgi:hypothetical protein